MAELERRRYRVVVEVEATARELDDEVVREAAARFSNAEEFLHTPEHAEHVARQQRLLAAIAKHLEIFDRWMWNQVLVLFEGSDTYNELVASEGGPENDWDMISQVLHELPEDDRRFFTGAEENELLAENTEEIFECFNARVISARVEEEFS